MAWAPPGNNFSYEGPVPREPQPGESAQERTVRVLQIYFNEAFQLYGRTLRLYALNPGSTDSDRRAATARADEEFDVFALNTRPPEVCDESARRGMVAMCAQLTHQFFAERAPHLLTWYADGTKLARFSAEYICKKLAGKPPEFNERQDPTFDYESPREFGVIFNNSASWWGATADTLEAELREGCGVELVDKIGYSYGDSEGQANTGTAVTRLRSAGATTIIPFTDFAALAAFTNQADGQGYYPEWFVPGFGGLDYNQLATYQNQNQWAHAFGISSFEMPRPFGETDCYRAYKQIDPSNEPHFGTCTYDFLAGLQLVAGLQEAGPKLTVQSFVDGLHTVGRRFPESPVWTIGGGYAPGDYSYTDDVVEMWWDPDAEDPLGRHGSGACGGPCQGAYRYVREGRRYRLGGLPQEEPLVFQEGVTSPPD